MGKSYTIGTGSKRGTFKWGDPHPTIRGKVFAAYVRQNGKDHEQWMDLDKWKERREKARLHKERSRGGKKPNKQTGSDWGYYKRGDKHPTIDLLFWSYGKYKGAARELWVTPEKFSDNRAKVSRNNARRRDKVGTYPEGSDLLLYKFRDILNQRHSHYAPRNGAFHIDHVTPIHKGGRHVSQNLRLTTAEFNLKKGSQ